MDSSLFLLTESVGQEKAHGSRVKIGVNIIWFTPLPCSSEPRRGPYWQWPIWKGVEAWIQPNFLSFAFRAASSSLPLSLPALSYLTQLIETLNGKIRLCPIPAFLWIVDWMCWWCGVLFLSGHFRSEGGRQCILGMPAHIALGPACAGTQNMFVFATFPSASYILWYV